MWLVCGRVLCCCECGILKIKFPGRLDSLAIKNGDVDFLIMAPNVNLHFGYWSILRWRPWNFAEFPIDCPCLYKYNALAALNVRGKRKFFQLSVHNFTNLVLPGPVLWNAPWFWPEKLLSLLGAQNLSADLLLSRTLIPEPNLSLTWILFTPSRHFAFNRRKHPKCNAVAIELVIPGHEGIEKLSLNDEVKTKTPGYHPYIQPTFNTQKRVVLTQLW